MEIVERKVFTEIVVEIGFDEYLENYKVIINEWMEKREITKCGILTPHYENSLDYIINKYGEEVMSDNFARTEFENLLSDITVLVLRRIAAINGWEVSHYGIYDKHKDIHTATFRRKGNYM